MKLLTFMTVATSVFAVNVQIAADRQQIKYNPTMLFEYIDAMDGQQNGVIENETFKKFISESTFPGQTFYPTYMAEVKFQSENYKPTDAAALDTIFIGAC